MNLLMLILIRPKTRIVPRNCALLAISVIQNLQICCFVLKACLDVLVESRIPRTSENLHSSACVNQNDKYIPNFVGIFQPSFTYLQGGCVIVLNYLGLKDSPFLQILLERNIQNVFMGSCCINVCLKVNFGGTFTLGLLFPCIAIHFEGLIGVPFILKG